MKFLRVNNVSNVCGYSVSHIWRMARDGNFPKPIKIGPNATAWLDSDIKTWMEARLNKNSRF